MYRLAAANSSNSQEMHAGNSFNSHNSPLNNIGLRVLCLPALRAVIYESMEYASAAGGQTTNRGPAELVPAPAKINCYIEIDIATTKDRFVFSPSRRQRRSKCALTPAQ